MKRIFATLLSITLLIGMLATSAFAWETPLGNAEGSNVSALTNSTVTPDMSKLISQELTGSTTVTELAFLIKDYKLSDNPDFTEAQRMDIGNHFKYGISLIGTSRLGRPVTAANDGYWTIGNTGSDVVSGKKANGAFATTLDNYLYNVNGDRVEIPAADATTPAPEGYVYRLMLTFNFGKIANLESFGYVNTWADGMLHDADIYVSDNGQDWTLVGYYSRTLNEKKFDVINAYGLGNDKTGKNFKELKDNGQPDGTLVLFDLPENTSGQFLRIAATKAVDNNPNNENGLREVMVFGTLTDQVGYTYVEGDGDYVDPNAGENNTDDTTETQATIVVKPPKNTTEETTVATPDNTAAPEESNTNTTEEKSGCGASISMSFAILATISAGALLIGRRRED